MSITRLDEQEKRVETGAVQFGDDWPGVFFRGDNAALYALTLKQVLESEAHCFDFLTRGQLEGLQSLLSSCVVGPFAAQLALEIPQ